MKNAVLRGYYGEHNAGDDAFLLVCAWGARKYLSSERIFASADSVPRACGIPIVPMFVTGEFRGRARWNLWRDSRICKRADSIIFGGGSNFHTASEMDYNLKLVQQAKQGPHCAIGVSIGPFRTPDAEPACARLLSKLTFVGVRDAASYDRAKRLAPDANVELTFDLAPLLLLAANLPSVQDNLPRRGLGISLCNYERFVKGDTEWEQSRLRVMADAIITCAHEGIIDEVVLIDFNGHPVVGDHEVHCQLALLLRDAVPIRHVPYEDDPIAALRIISGLRGIVAMRLHAAIFGFCMRTPTLMLSYHEKCREWARTVGSPDILVINAACFQVEEAAESIRCLLEPNSPMPILSPETAIERSLTNWGWNR